MLNKDRIHKATIRVNWFEPHNYRNTSCLSLNFCSLWIFLALVLILSFFFQSWLLRFWAASSFCFWREGFTHLPLALALHRLFLSGPFLCSAHSLYLIVLNALSTGCGAQSWWGITICGLTTSQLPQPTLKTIWLKKVLESHEIVLAFGFVVYVTAGDLGQRGTGCWVSTCILGSVSIHKTSEHL